MKSIIEPKLEVKTLAEKGLFLQEILTRNGTDIQFLMNDDSKRLMSERFDLWQKKAGGNGGELAFKKRLVIKNLPPEQLKENWVLCLRKKKQAYQTGSI